MVSPVVDKEKCVGCGACVSVCPADVFKLKEGKSVVVNPDNCIGCGSCVENCPVKAIKLQ
ncbi:MAG: ferredoxin [Candidatus Aenigmatarchaeota archaeon]|nr:MAG: ferredoxin [Candidatus Aenigmarchaeota archaeon]